MGKLQTKGWGGTSRLSIRNEKNEPIFQKLEDISAF